MIGSSLPRWWFSTVTTFSGLVLFAGFDRPAASGESPPDKSHTTGATGWNAAPATTPAAGIEQAMVHWHARNGRLAYVVWSDLPGGPGSAFGSGVEATRSRVRQDAKLSASDGERLELRYEYAPGKGVESVSCANSRHGLGAGRLLLVTGPERNRSVVQLPLDAALADILMDPDQTEDGLRATLRAYARSNPSFRDHFGGPEPSV
jgi:hypothetical protein